VAFSADGTILVSCGVDKTIRLWNVQTREQIAVLSSGRRIGCLALSPDDRTLATGSGWVDDADVASEILFWDLQSRQLLTNLVDGVGVIRVLQFSGDGKFLVVGQARDTVTKLVDVAAKRVIFSSTNLERFVALSPDGRTLASPTLADLERIALFDTSTHRILGSVESPSGATRYLAFSPDGKTLAVAYANARIKLCHLASGRDVTTLEGHDGFCWSLVFSHDGQTLASAASDRTLRLWRAPTNEVAVARQTTGQVR
jgi:WD40 repeat protein